MKQTIFPINLKNCDASSTTRRVKNVLVFLQYWNNACFI